MKLRHLLGKLSPSSNCTVTIMQGGKQLHKATAKTILGNMALIPEWILGSTIHHYTINAYSTRMEVAIYIRPRREYGGGKKK